jgi:hypothetical protein
VLQHDFIVELCVYTFRCAPFVADFKASAQLADADRVPLPRNGGSGQMFASAMYPLRMAVTVR